MNEKRGKEKWKNKKHFGSMQLVCNIKLNNNNNKKVRAKTNIKINNNNNNNSNNTYIQMTLTGICVSVCLWMVYGEYDKERKISIMSCNTKMTVLAL